MELSISIHSSEDILGRKLFGFILKRPILRPVSMGNGPFDASVCLCVSCVMEGHDGGSPIPVPS